MTSRISNVKYPNMKHIATKRWRNAQTSTMNVEMALAAAAIKPQTAAGANQRNSSRTIPRNTDKWKITTRNGISQTIHWLHRKHTPEKHRHLKQRTTTMLSKQLTECNSEKKTPATINSFNHKQIASQTQNYHICRNTATSKWSKKLRQWIMHLLWPPSRSNLKPQQEWNSKIQRAHFPHAFTNEKSQFDTTSHTQKTTFTGNVSKKHPRKAQR